MGFDSVVRVLDAAGAQAAGRPTRTRTGAASWGGRALQFDRVAFRIRQVEGRPVAFGAVACLDLPHRHAVRDEVSLDGSGVERLDAQAEVIDVARRRARCRAAGTAERAIDPHEVDQRASGAQLHQAEFRQASFLVAAEHAGLEIEHARLVPDAQHEMVETQRFERWQAHA